MAKGYKTGGRLKGTPNKVTGKTQAQIRDYFQTIVEGNLGKLNDDLQTLKPEQRLKYFIELAKFVVPQLKATELNMTGDAAFKPVTVSLMTREEVEEIQKHLESKY